MRHLFSDRFLEQLDHFAIRRSRIILGVTGLLTVVLASPLPRLRIENSPDQLELPSADSCRVEMAQFDETFGTGNAIVVGVESDESLNARDIRMIDSLTRSLAEIEGVSSILSLTTAFKLEWIPSGGMMELQARLRFPSFVKRSETATAEVLRQLIAHPLYGGALISGDGRKTAIVIVLTPDPAPEGGIRRLSRILDETKRRAEAHGSSRLRFHFAGTPLIALELDRALKRDVAIFAPVSLLAFLLMFGWVFRSIIPVVVGFGAAGLTLVWTLGIMAWAGAPMSLSLSIIIPLIPSLTLVYATHYLSGASHGSQRLDSGVTRKGSLFSQVTVPSLICGVTTIVGFLSLASSPLRGLRETGLYVSAGIASAVWITNFALPALLHTIRIEDRHAGVAQSSLLRFMIALQRMVLRHPLVVVLLVMLIGLLATAGMLFLRVETNHLEYLEETGLARRDFAFVDHNLGGVIPVEISVRFPPEQSARAVLDMAEAASTLRQLPGMGSVICVADVIMQADEARSDPDAIYYPAIDLQRMVLEPQIWRSVTDTRLGGAYVHRTDSLITCRIGCRAHIAGSATIGDLLTHVNSVVNAQLGGYRPVVTGTAPYFVRIERYVVSTQIRSFLTALAVTILLLGLLGGTWRVGLAIVAVNVLPVTMVLGAMGWLGIRLDIATVMIASITIGIVVDDTIHILYQYRRELAKGRTVQESLASSFLAVGVPITASTITLCLGFLSLAPARFAPTSYFGYLAALTILVAAIVELVLLPALLMVLSNQDANVDALDG